MISAGPNPDSARSNGYLDALPPALAARGHEIFQLHMAGVGPWQRGLQVEHSEQGGTRIIAIRNSGVYAGLPPGGGAGTAQPGRDVRASGQLRAAVRAILRDTRPEVVHIQNLFGLPADLIPEFQHAGAAVVLTAHDYSSICPTAHLFRPEGHNCTLSRNELTCSQCCRAAPTYAAFRVGHGLDRRLHALPRGSLAWGAVARVRNGLLRLSARARSLVASDAPYRRRFDGMQAMLQRLDVVHCISRAQATRLQASTGPLPRLRILPLVPPSVTRCHPIARDRDRPSPLRFAVLNVLPGRDEKGWSYLHEVLQRIERRRQDFQVDWYADGQDTACVRYRGRYVQNELDRIAADSDFCLIPSIWHETLGFTGVEMLSRGVPLICSQRCGVAEGVRDGVTGLLFDPSSPEKLEQVLDRVLDNPQLGTVLRQAQASACSDLPAFPQHVASLETLLADARQALPSR